LFENSTNELSNEESEIIKQNLKYIRIPIRPVWDKVRASEEQM
jgi:hypothetical protein